jgi:hypothetical protein
VNKDARSRGRWLALMAFAYSAAASADVIVVQCTIDTYRTSFASRPDIFVIQVDLEARAITTYYGTTRLKMTKRQIGGVGRMPGGWQTSVTIDRNTGRLAAASDRIDGRKYSFVDLKGTCILPQELQGAGPGRPEDADGQETRGIHQEALAGSAAR